MPSSLIFAGLVVLWLLILVPAVARRRQEVARLSPAVLSGRVLERPTRHRLPEVDMTERRDDGGATTVGELADQRDDVPSPRTARDWDDEEIDDSGELTGSVPVADQHDGPTAADGAWDGTDHLDDAEEDAEDRAPAARYRPGRGGFDPEAAAATAHARYAFRQRLVLALLVLLLAAGVLALLVSDVFWWLAAAAGLVLAGYLTYLRRQVRIEESIRSRRAARLGGARHAPADDLERDEWADRAEPEPADAVDADVEDSGDERDEDGGDEDWTADDGETARVRGTGAPLGVLPARRRTVDGSEGAEHASSLPRVTATALPPIPAGTSLVDVDDEEQLDAATGVGEHRRAAGE